LTARSIVFDAILGRPSSVGVKSREYALGWAAPDNEGDSVSRMDGLSPAVLRREVRDCELILSQVPAAGDEAAEKRWGEAMIDLCDALPKLARFEELLQRIDEAEPTLASVDRLRTVWIYAHVTRAAALTALKRYDEALRTVDAVLGLLVDAKVERRVDGQSDVMLGRTRLRSVAISGRGQIRTESRGMRALSRLAVIALQTRVVALIELGRLEEAYEDACRLADAPDSTPAERRRIERALILQIKIARRQHRYDLAFLAALRIARLKAGRAIGDPRAKLTKRGPAS
jgi:tetratricopeptide (TPR) repeat protein